MSIWSAEIKELERLYESFKGQFPELEKELERLIKADDENMILLYSRRCLEVIITDLCECELKRPRKTEPLKGIIDKLHHEEKVPAYIITSMHGLNDLSTYGTHPKDFDPRQVKPVLNNLATIIDWYIKYKDTKVIYHPKPEKEKAESKEPVEISESIKRSKIRTIFLITGLTLVVIIVVAALFVFDIISGNKQVKEVEKSIAVLPFINDSPDSTNLYFCNGMMEDILDNLVKIEDLNVKSRTDVEPYRATSKSLKNIGRELGVANILEGSVRKQGNRFKISVQLIFAETGFHLWSDTYEGEYSEEIFSVTSNLAQKIATALKAIITREEKETIERVPTTDLIAYDLYIRAKYEVEKYWDNHDRKHMLEAQKLLDRAIEIDPGFEKALREKAYAYLGLNKYDSLTIYANKLLSIDPKSGDGYFMKGEAYRFAGVPDSSIKNYLMAIKYLSKDNIEDRKYSEFCIGSVYCYQKNDYMNGLQWLQKGLYLKEDKSDWAKYEILGWMFSNIGDYEKSDKYFKKSLECEATGVNIRYYSLSLIGQSKFTEALNFLDTICRQPESMTTCSEMRFYIHVLRKEFELAEQFYTQFLTTGGTLNVADSIWIAYMYKETGKEQESLTILKNCQISLEKRLDKASNSNLFLNLSLLHAILDQKEEANKYLSKAVDLGLINGWHDFLEICPIFENLWNDPVFKALVKRAQKGKAAIRAQVGEMEKRGEIDDLLSLINIK